MEKTELKLKIEYVPIESLTPYEKNARKHQEVDVNYIKNSIKQFGMADPIGVWSDKNIVVEGHGRLLALQELGYKEVPIIRLDHLTDEERKAYALAHNRTAEMSSWDFDTMEEEIDKISDQFDFKDFGFGAFLSDDEVDEYDDAELTEHNHREKEIECPHCGEKFFI